MKSNNMYKILITGIVLLLGIAATLTLVFLGISQKETTPETTAEPQRIRSDVKKVTATSETTIKLDETADAPKVESRDWRAERRPKQKPSFTPPAPSGKPGIATVSALSGKVTVTKEDGKPLPLENGARIMLNDEINTSFDSQLQLTFDDGTIISQGQNSTLVIDEYLYTPSDPEKNKFTMRFVKGVCRTVTGMITNLNPERFKVKSRMATIGIRGCDLVFESSQVTDNIYVLDLAGKKLVMVDTTSNGSPVRNLEENEELTIDDSILKSFKINQPGTMISITRGSEPKQLSISAAETRQLITRCSDMPPAKYRLHQEPSGMVFQIKPTVKED